MNWAHGEVEIDSKCFLVLQSSISYPFKTPTRTAPSAAPARPATIISKTTQRLPNAGQFPQGHSAVRSRSAGYNWRPWNAHPQVDVQSTDSFNFGLGQIERGAVQIGLQPIFCVCLGNDRNALLRRPAQKNLTRFCSRLQFLSHAAGRVTYPFHGPEQP